MTPEIEAIFLDVGNTLRIVVEDPVFQQQAKDDLMTLVNATETPKSSLKSWKKTGKLIAVSQRNRSWMLRNWNFGHSGSCRTTPLKPSRPTPAA